MNKENTTMTNENIQEEQTVEEMFGSLDQVMKQMETGESSLEETFHLYYQGMELLKKCSQQIDQIEKKVLVLDEDGDTHEF